jgi:hypothetical protein
VSADRLPFDAPDPPAGQDDATPVRRTVYDLHREEVEAAADRPVLQARGSDPETSHAAMQAFDAETMMQSATLAADLHRAHGPMADFEFHEVWNRAWFEAHGVTPSGHLYQQARSVARDFGQIRDSGTRKRNPGTGRQQVVWEACDEPRLTIRQCPTCGHVLRREPAKGDTP